MSILIGADILPTENNHHLFQSGNIEELIGEELHSLFDKVSYRIFNLEGPLTDRITPISKCGPNLCAPTDTSSGLKKLKINLLSLANNHIMDQGEQGLYSTVTILKNEEIKYVGGGYD